MAERDDRPHDRGIAGVRVHRRDERAVDLDLIELEPREVRERRVAGAEVVDRDADAERAQATDDRLRLGRVGDDRALGDLQHQAIAGELPLLQEGRHVVRQRLLVEVPHRKVDRNRQPVAVGVPLLDLAERLVEHELRDRVDQPGLLGQRDEVEGRHESARRVTPADQRLDARQRARAHVHLRLVVQHELALRDRTRQLGEQRQPVGVVMVDLGRVDHAWRAGLLRRVHRDVGTLDEQIDVGPVLREERHPDARLDVERQAADLERATDRLEDPRKRLIERVEIADARHDEPELVSAEARDGVALANRGLEASRELDEQQVAVVVPERVVDLLEAVEVDQHDAERLVLDRDRALDPLAEEGAVGEAGQAVVQRLVEVALLARAHRCFRARAFDREARDVRCDLDELEIVRIALPRLGVVHRERADQLAVDRHDRHRPACAQAMPESELAVVRPERIAVNV